MENQEKFEAWAIVELFGHQKMAGKCTEQNIAGTNMLRIDVPKTNAQPAFTRFLNHAAIYALNPVTEDVALHMASRIQVAPIDVWDVKEFIKQQKLALTAEASAREEDKEVDDPELTIPTKTEY